MGNYLNQSKGYDDNYQTWNKADAVDISQRFVYILSRGMNDNRAKEKSGVSICIWIIVIYINRCIYRNNICVVYTMKIRNPCSFFLNIKILIQTVNA